MNEFKVFTGSLNQNPVKMEAKCFPCCTRGCTKQFDCFKPAYKSIFWGFLQCRENSTSAPESTQSDVEFSFLFCELYRAKI